MMKIKLLEAYFNTPEQVRRKREQEKAKSSAERISATASSVYNNTITDILNKVIEKNDICMFPDEYLRHSAYYDLTYYIPSIGIRACPFVHRKNDVKILSLNRTDNEITLNVTTDLALEYSGVTNNYSDLCINVEYINNGHMLTEGDVLIHKEYFIKNLQFYLRKEVSMGNIPDYGESILELFNNSTVKIDKINLFAGRSGDIYITPVDRIEDNIYDSGKYISTTSMKYRNWGVLAPIRVMRQVCKFFTFANSGKVYFKYTNSNDGEADMKTLKSPKLFKDVENFVKTAVTMSNKGFTEYLLGIGARKDGRYEALRDPRSVTIPMKDKVQFLKLTTQRQIAIDGDQFTVDKIEREIVTPNALLNVNKMTGEMTAGDDFESLNPDITVNAIVYITLAGIKEQIGVRYIIDNKCKLPNPQKYKNTVCTDMGVNTLHDETRDIEGIKRNVFAFPNSRFPWLSSTSSFAETVIDYLENRCYAINCCLSSDSDISALKKASENLAMILYFDATDIK